MIDISSDKLFETITMHKCTLTAPGKLGETILYRSNENKERKPKKIINTQYTIKGYGTGFLTVEDRKIHKSYGGGLEDRYYKGNTNHDIEAMEGIYKTGCFDEFDREVFVRGYLINNKLHQKSFFVLTELTDRKGLHERTKNGYNYTIKE